jgi:hypothetical protein
LANSWTWVNFSWKNDSLLSGAVAWKIYINDTTGKENVTEEKTFYVQFRRLPVACQDSDGDCDFARLNESDGVFEAVDLLTYPFGWINVSDWDLDVPENTLIQSAYLHVLWYSDVDFGASNINIDYWNGSYWVNCAGPFGENESLSDSVCDITILSRNRLNNIKVRVRGQDVDGFPMAFLYVDQIFIVANYSIGVPYLEVELVLPEPLATTYVVQNTTFLINAIVYCRVGNCNNVYGTVMYNLTSPYPDTAVNTSFGDKPFFINETPALAMKSCPNNPLNADDFCNLTWVVNATGDTGTTWKIGVLFNSSLSEVQENHTDNATVFISLCTEEINLAWTSIDFGFLSPNTNYNPAPYNNQNFYNVTNKGTCTLNLWIKGTDLENSTLGTTITVGNVSWSNTTNETSSSFNMTYSYVLLSSGLTQNKNLTTYYWLSVPPIYAGYYIGSVFICGNYTSIC